ncbi:hypothetical protein WR25_06786 [Diploscapter pachys]|uniref:Innexin n=1 Tax=Diploscapter pachys TaxID=2018661 RepID=A0A2A2KDV3_9BILA|nr:hypothetical protein WR25_06786 [Diploscapter pachys]
MNIIQGLLQAVSPQSDGDFSDRLSYCVTTVGLVVASAFVSSWSFVGQPIQCWFPAYYRSWWMEYALDYCYVQNTYFVPFADVPIHDAFDFTAHVVEIPKNISERESKEIGYYQWVPFILAFQAILFYIPIALWRALYEGAGYKVRTICDTCSMSGNMNEETRKSNMKKICAFLVQEHTIYSQNSRKSHWKNRVSSGTYLVLTYLVIKFIYVANAVFQFALLKGLLGVKTLFWGFVVATDLLNGREWPQTGNFPRVTYCDYEVRVEHNLHRHTVQCVLLINLFNEVIFVGVWFWLLFIVVVSTISFLKWLAVSFGSSNGRRFVEKYLTKIDKDVRRSDMRGHVQQFVTEYLRADGLFIARLVESNHGDMVTCALLKTCWEEFISKRRQPPQYAEPLLMKGIKGNNDDDESSL